MLKLLVILFITPCFKETDVKTNETWNIERKNKENRTIHSLDGFEKVKPKY